MTFGLLPNTRRVTSVISKKRVWSRQEMEILILIKGQIVPILNRVDTREFRSRNPWTGTVYSTDQTSAEKDIESICYIWYAALSRPCLAGHTDDGHVFSNKSDKKIFSNNPDKNFSNNPKGIRAAGRIETDRIETADRQRAGFSGKTGQKPDKDRTRTVLSADVYYRYFTVR